MLCIKNLFANEISVDLFWRKKLNINPQGVNYRPIKYKSLNSLPVYYYLLFFLWLPILTVSNLYFFLKSMKKKTAALNNLENKKIWINASIKSEQIKERQELADLMSIDIREGDYFSYLTRLERLKFLFLSLGYVWFKSSSFSIENKLHLLDLYRVRCFLEFIIKINLISTELHLSNHYDRWAMSCYRAYSKGVELWQHGIVDESFPLDIKLTNLLKVHCLNAHDEPWWRANSIGHNIEFLIQKKLFQLTANKNNIEVLIASNPAFIEEELALFELLLANPQLQALRYAYKPHPAYGDYKNLKRLSDKVLILDRDEYPRVKLVIHSGSTLGQEYESIGIKTYDYTNKQNKSVVLDVAELMNLSA